MVEDKLPQTLDEVREAIDGLDKELIELLVRRQKLVRQAGRLNNPFAESLNLDPDGRFIRRHLPELAHLPTSALHAPHLAGSDVETNGYPPPCVQV